MRGGRKLLQPGDERLEELLAEAARHSGMSLWRDARRRFRANRVAFASLVFLGAFALLALAAPLLPLPSPVTLDLQLEPQPPVAPWEIFGERGFEPEYWELSRLDGALVRARVALFGDWQSGPWLGTDGMGRDILSRIVWGSRTSIGVALAATLCSLVLGVGYGALAGYLGGRIDEGMMRLVDVLYAIPFIFVVIFLITVVNEYRTELEDGFGIDREVVFYVVIGAVFWLTMARVVRGQVLALRSAEFIDAARVLGASTARVLLLHLVPNVLSVVVVYLTLTIPAVMLFEAFLSFLGLGIEPPKVSWGLLAVDGSEAINPLRLDWWLVVFPAAAMGSTLLALNLVGDGLRDALDPRLRGKELMALLEVQNLSVRFDTFQGVVRAVNRVSFTLEEGETLGLVGESGSGKSVTSLAVMGLVPRPPGVVDDGFALFEGRDLLRLSPRELRRVRGARIAMIFQDPMTSLNPFLPVGRQLGEVLEVHEGLSRREAARRAAKALDEVGLPRPERTLKSYPHQLSGGMRQRVMIAMAILCRPRILFADEPTTALDVTTQAQILELLAALQHRHGTGLVLVTHDLGVVAGASDSVKVMYAGRLVETAPTAELFARPAHPYTAGLLASVPRLTGEREEALYSIPGQPPDLATLPAGCSFRPRCPRGREECEARAPELVLLERERRAACVDAVQLLAGEGAKG